MGLGKILAEILAAVAVVWIGSTVLSAREPESRQTPRPTDRVAYLGAIHRRNSHVYKDKDLNLPPRSPDIRVLELDSSARESDKLVCRLKVVPLDSHYRALSYAWGDACDTTSITLNGLRFEITRNLAAALRRIRFLRLTSRTPLWVDAVCINQGDDIEKGHQLLRMRDIYGGAFETLVWLGEGTPRSDRAMTYFGEKSSKVNMDKVLQSYGENTWVWCGLKVDQLIKDYEDNQQAWHGLGDVMLRQYFRRLWIIQEVIVSDTVVAVCGELCLPFYMLTNMMSIAMDHSLDIVPTNLGVSSPYQRNIAFLQLFRNKYRTRELLPLRHLIPTYALRHKCGDDRDRVFAVLGLASDRHARQLAGLNYDGSANDTYEAATSHIISTGVDLDFICLGHGPTRTTEHGFPSWVPDLRLSFSDSAATLSRNLYLQTVYYAAAGRDISSSDVRIARNARYWKGVTHQEGPTFLDNGKVLVTPGVWFDHISDVGQTYLIDIHDIDEVQRVHHRAVLAESLRMAQACTAGDLAFQPYVKGAASYLEAYARTLTCDRNVSGQRCRDGEGFFPYTQYRPAEVSVEEFITRMSPRLEEVDPHIHRIRKRFMVSKGGLMGMVPLDAMPGDSIFVLFGCSVPVIMRKVERHSPTHGPWTFVGESYVHGIMDGEVIEDVARGKAWAESFHIA